jgi:transcriptional regulator with XRE-family HTH domain
MQNSQRISQEAVQLSLYNEVSKVSRKLKSRLSTLQIENGYLISSRIVSATALKQALHDQPRLSISTMILLENATGGCLYLKFVPIQTGKQAYCLKLKNAGRSCLGATFASFFKPLLKDRKPEELALESGLSLTTIKNLKNDANLPNLKTIFKMARALGYDTSLLTMEKAIFKI